MACKQKVPYIGGFMQLMCRILRVLFEVAMSLRHSVALVSRSHKIAKRFSLALQPHSHYCLILDDIGHKPTLFTTTKELVETLTGALQGMYTCSARLTLSR